MWLFILLRIHEKHCCPALESFPYFVKSQMTEMKRE